MAQKAPPPQAPPPQALPPPPSGTPPNCPPGMHYLMNTGSIWVKQQFEMMEILTGFETNNRYDILDANGVRMYIAAEMSDMLSRNVLGSYRNFNMTVLDNSAVPVLRMQRSFTGDCSCTGNMVSVTTPDNAFLIGTVVEESCCVATFSIRDGNGNVKLNINGPTRCCLIGQVAFPVCDLNGQEIGVISKQWRGIMAESYTDADTFGVTFPENLEPTLKCILLGATFLIDFMFFESTGGGAAHRRGGYGYGYGRY